MAPSLPSFWPLACLGALGAVLCNPASAEDDALAGPAYAKYRLTLAPGWREEAAGPFFYQQTSGGQRQWALPPFFCRTVTPDVDWDEWEIFYPVVDYRRFGKEYQLELGQVFNFTGGATSEQVPVRRTTAFPIYFRQRSQDTNLNYTAVAPFYGHLKNRLFRDDIKFIMFPIYSETRKKDVVTDNYFYPVFDRRRGDGLTGWEVWPLAGKDHKTTTYLTNSFQEVQRVGGYDKVFALWPAYIKSRTGLGTTNPVASTTMVPFYSQTRSPSRDQTSYGFPFGFNATEDREHGYVEHDFLWPLFVWAHGSKNVTRYFPLYSRARHNGLESDFYGFVFYKYNRLEAPPLDRHRSRVLFFLYSDTVERNTQTHESKRRVDFWPLYTYSRDMDGNRRRQIFTALEPFFPNNRTISREYAPLWMLWRDEKNARTGATSRSLLWNLYRHESAGGAKKSSLLFGLIQYQSSSKGGRWRLCYLNLGRKPARNTTAKS